MREAVAAPAVSDDLAWQEAVTEILGPEGGAFLGGALGMEALLPLLCERYGEMAGLGIGVRVGRALARRLIPVAAEDFGLQRADFRLLPWPRKMLAGLQHFAAAAPHWFGTAVRVEPSHGAVLWLPHRCPFAPAAQNLPACRCTPWEGFLQEVLYWLSGGRMFSVSVEGGAMMAFRIPYRPLH